MPRQRAGFCSRRREKQSEEIPGDAAGLAKTKLCKYHILGQCMKGRGCQFAHHVSEIMVTPDTSHAKVCRNLINTGRCNEPGCPYVHNRQQLFDKPVGLSVSRLDQASRLCFATFAPRASACRSLKSQIPVADDKTQLSLDAELTAPTVQHLQKKLSCDVAALWQPQAQEVQELGPESHLDPLHVHCAQPQCSVIQAAHAVGSRWMARVSGFAPTQASLPILQPLAPPEWSWPAGCEDLIDRRAASGNSLEPVRRSEDSFPEDGTDSADKLRVVVKNTFINVVVPGELSLEQMQRRSSSASPRLSNTKHG